MTTPRPSTTKATEFSSSIEAETCAGSEWQTVAELGSKIISTLEHLYRRHGDPDLLSHWMAQEIAAALAAAQAEGPGGPASERARTLILDVWSHRTAWPKGWPPEEAILHLRGLVAATAAGPAYAVEHAREGGSPWLDGVARLHRLADEETRIWLMVGLLETGTDAEREALRAAPSVADEDDDLWAMRKLVALHDQAQSWAEKAGATDGAARADLARAELDRVADERRRLTDDVMAAGSEGDSGRG